MIIKTSKLLLAAVSVLLLVCNSTCEISEESVEKINNGIELGETMLDTVSKLGKSKLFDSLGNMAGFLGPVGGIISFALLFAPKSESEELQYMKKKFAEVNRKLDQITSELDNVKDLITYENQRSVYVKSASKIEYGYQQLLHFLDELQNTSCTNKKSCDRERIRIGERYVKDFNVKEHLFMIVNGATRKISQFNEPLLELVRKTFKCDVGKIDDLANGILRLSFKAQQVILAYEKLKGSNHSITQSVNDWLKAVYDLREATYIIKKPCFDHISTYMIADIKDKKYQIDASSNEEATRMVKTFMEKKYKWLGWVAYSFDTTDGSKYCVSTLPKSDFWNLPGDKNVRKRSLVVSFTDKSGTYYDPKIKMRDAIDNIVKAIIFSNEAACTIRDEFERELRKQGVWKYITSFALLSESNGLVIKDDKNPDTYISSIYDIKIRPQQPKSLKLFETHRMHLVVILKSKETAIKKSCEKTCNNQSNCETLPYSSANYCHCKPYYQGANCEEHSQAQLAKTIDSMLQATLRLPKLSDIAFQIQDLREYLGISIGKVQSTFKRLEATFTKAFYDLDHRLTTQFKLSNLISVYNAAISNIQYYSDQFQNLKERTDEKTIATHVLKTGAISKWLFEVNYLFLGRTTAPLLNHQPLLIILMEKHKSLACTSEYKAAIDNIWRQLVLLQQMGFVVWAQALQIKGLPTEHVAKLYNKRATKQVSALNRMTCEYSIVNSANVQCTGGRYLYPGMTIANQCKAHYYATGRKETTCEEKGSGCSPCNCNNDNSNGNECLDTTGQCNCKHGFKGNKCNDRDCVWGAWSKYSDIPCSKRCDYGGMKTRTRSHQLTKQGNGKQCNGPGTESITCFNGCCPDQYLCFKSNPEKCIPMSQRCDYENNCGDNKDEIGCDEHCDMKTTDWAEHDDGNMVYLDRITVDCGGDNEVKKVLKMFHLERDRGYVRYKYKCCTLKKPICTNARKVNGFTPDGGGNAVYLDRQTVSCGNHAYLNEFVLRRNGAHNHIRYEYNCCNLNEERYRRKTVCKEGLTTPYSYHDREGRSVYLDRQTVECQGRSFLTSFVLERNHGGSDLWRYRYTCCEVKP